MDYRSRLLQIAKRRRVFFPLFFDSFLLLVEESRGKMFACAWLV